MTQEEFDKLPTAFVDEKIFAALPVAVDESNFDHVPLLEKIKDLGTYGLEQAGVASGNLLDLGNKVMPINVGLQALGLKTPSSYSLADVAKNPALEKKVTEQTPLSSLLAGTVGQAIPYAVTAGLGPAFSTLKGQAALGGLTGLASTVHGTPTEQLAGTGAGTLLGALLGKVTKSPSTPEEVALQSRTADIAARGPELFEGVTQPMREGPDPVTKIILALKAAKPVREEQQALYTAERAKRFAQAQVAGTGKQGEAQLFTELGALRGQLPKAEFESIRNQLTPDDITSLFDQVRQAPGLSFIDTVAARQGLLKLLGEEGASVPTNSEIVLLNEVFPKEFTETLLTKRAPWEQFKYHLNQVINLPKSYMSSIDFSAPLRQGVFLGPSYPKEFGSGFKDMFKYAFDQRAYDGMLNSIKLRPNYPAMKQTKLALTDVGALLETREEAFLSNLAERTPIFGRFIKGSNRAYSGFLTKLRADVFDSLYNTAKDTYGNQIPTEVVQGISNFVNTATGRGSLGALEKSAPFLNNLLFSPRLMASRIQLLNPGFYVTLPPVARKQALKSLLSFTSAGMGILGLAKLGGADVVDEPTSPDFGKIKIGNTRLDIWGGLQQYVVLASKLITNESTSSITGQTKELGQGYKADTRLDVVLKALRNKLSPAASFATGLLSGKDLVGKPFNVPKATAELFAPMVYTDIKEVIQDRGWTGAPLALPSIFGVGVQTYSKTKR